MRTTWFKSGDWSAICDVCGFKFKASELRLRWDGLYVCNGDWEIRQPQDLIRPIPDQQKLPWTRPDVAPVYWATVCTPTTQQGVAGIGTAGCAKVGYNLGYSAT